MGIKLLVAKHGKTQKITIKSEVIHNGKKTRTFPIDKMKEALDYAVTINSEYIDTISDDIYYYAEAVDHPLLWKKDFSLC